MSEEVYVKGRVIGASPDGYRNVAFNIDEEKDKVSVWFKEDLLLTREDLQLTDLKAIDAMVQAAYKAGKEGKPLMIALNEEVTT